MIVLLAWLAPLCASLGALAPNFWVLTATQTIARPLGIALDLLIARGRRRGDAAQQPRLRGQRAGDGERAGCRRGGDGTAPGRPGRRRLAARVRRRRWCGWSRPSTCRGDSPRHRRFEHVVETHQRRAAHTSIGDGSRSSPRSRSSPTCSSPRRRSSRTATSTTSAATAPPSITLFTLTTATPASLGFVFGGRLADTRGRRRLLALSLPARHRRRSSCRSSSAAGRCGWPRSWAG